MQRLWSGPGGGSPASGGKFYELSKTRLLGVAPHPGARRVEVVVGKGRGAGLPRQATVRRPELAGSRRECVRVHVCVLHARLSVCHLPRAGCVPAHGLSSVFLSGFVEAGFTYSDVWPFKGDTVRWFSLSSQTRRLGGNASPQGFRHPCSQSSTPWPSRPPNPAQATFIHVFPWRRSTPQSVSHGYRGPLQGMHPIPRISREGRAAQKETRPQQPSPPAPENRYPTFPLCPCACQCCACLPLMESAQWDSGCLASLMGRCVL